MSDIFISYSREDVDRARSLAGALEEDGWSVWWDRRILPGQVFDEVIHEAIDLAACVIVLWSRTSVVSHWVKEEADTARLRGVLVPVFIDEVAPPLGFGRIQAGTLVGWEGERDHPGYASLQLAIANTVGRPPAREVELVPSPEGPLPGDERPEEPPPEPAPPLETDATGPPEAPPERPPRQPAEIPAPPPSPPRPEPAPEPRPEPRLEPRPPGPDEPSAWERWGRWVAVAAAVVAVAVVGVVALSGGGDENGETTSTTATSGATTTAATVVDGTTTTTPATTTTGAGPTTSAVIPDGNPPVLAFSGVPVSNPFPTLGAQFGAAVALDEDTLAVGEPGPGSVLVYPAGGGLAWGEPVRITSPGAEGDRFGQQIALDGGTLAVGAFADAVNGANAGAVHVFVAEDGDWVVQGGPLRGGTNELAGFGADVALQGDMLLVGAPGQDETGAVFVYARVNGTWGLSQTLRAEEPEVDAEFGGGLAIDGDLLAVSAPGTEDATVPARVYLYRLTGGAWVLQDEIVPGTSADKFGSALALEDGLLIVGASRDDAGGGPNDDAGAVYVYRCAETCGEPEAVLRPSGVGSGDRFGVSVAVESGRVLAGAPFADGGAVDSGIVYEYVVRDGEWTFSTIEPEAPAAGALFGFSVDLEQGRLASGSPNYDDEFDNQGAAYS